MKRFLEINRDMKIVPQRFVVDFLKVYLSKNNEEEMLGDSLTFAVSLTTPIKSHQLDIFFGIVNDSLPVCFQTSLYPAVADDC